MEKVYDFLATTISVGKVSSGTNAGDYYLNVEFKRLVNGKVVRGVPGVKDQIWKRTDSELIDAVRRLYPAKGKDANGKDWNGLDDTKDGATFDPLSVVKNLRTMNGDEDWLLFFWCRPEIYKFETPMVMKYSTDMNGHKAGEWVCRKDGYIRIFTERRILVRYNSEEGTPGDYMPGWSPEERIEQFRRNLIPISKVLEEKPQLVPPELRQVAPIPSLSIATDDEVNAAGDALVNEER